MIGDHFQLPPVVQNFALKTHSNFDQSLFARFARLKVPLVALDLQGRSRASLATLFAWRYPALGDLPAVLAAPQYLAANAGFRFEAQFVDVGDYRGRGESAPAPHFYQNLGEAEYVVQVYMYMRLLGYPAGAIVVLAAYNGQRKLLRDVIRRRCEGSAALERLFGRPAKVATVDKFQGRQSDFVLLSLVRTEAEGHLRDVRRLVVALSRARLGLYVFGRRGLFERAAGLRGVFSRLLVNGDKLALVRGEAFGAVARRAEVGSLGGGGGGCAFEEVAGVEAMGRVVEGMTKEALRGERRRWEEEINRYSEGVKKLKA